MSGPDTPSGLPGDPFRGAGEADAESERRRLILDSALDAIVTIDARGMVLDWNRRAETMFGWSAAEALGHHLNALIIPERHREAHDRGMRRFLESGEGPILNRRAEMEAMRRDGTEFPVELTVAPARIGGEWIFSSFIRDLSEAKAAADRLRKAERENREREDLLRLVMDAAPALISYIDRDHRYRFVNHTYETWFGHDRTWIAGRSMEEVLGPEAYARLLPFVEAALAGEELSFEGTFPYRYAGPRYVRINYLPHRGVDGSVEGFVVFVVDLSERRDLEEALRGSEERSREAADRLSLIFTHVNDILVLADVEGPDSFRIVEANEAYLSRSALDRGALLGRLLAEIVPPDRYEVMAAPLREVARTGQPVTEERRSVSTREEIVVEARYAPIRDEAGRVAKILMVARDISALRRREEELRQSQKMEAVGRLAGGIAHDFNNLLTAIQGFTELAIQAPGSPAPVKDMLAEVKRSAERAAGLTGQLLAFSRKQILAPRVLDLNAAVASMETLLRRVIGEDVDLVTDPAQGLRPTRMDPGQLEQIILNLVLNARDAMPQGGRLTLATRAAEVSGAAPGTRLEARPGAYVSLAVADTGVGMPPEVLERLFEPFFTTKEQGKGTGMGLATVYGIVQQSGGHIHVRSEPGKGSVFTVYLPAEEGEVPAARKPETGKVPLTRGRGDLVLLVEDEDVVRAYASRVLEGLGYRVLPASRGREALEAAERAGEPIPLLLTDVVMPGMSGREVWEALKPRHPGMRVLFMSGYADTAIVHHGVLDEDAPFLAKPFSPAQLARKVGEVLSGSGSRPA